MNGTAWIPIGRERWGLQLVSGPVIDDDGAACMFRVDRRLGMIFVSDTVPPEHRPAVGALAVVEAIRPFLPLVPIRAVC